MPLFSRHESIRPPRRNAIPLVGGLASRLTSGVSAAVAGSYVTDQVIAGINRLYLALVLNSNTVLPSTPTVFGSVGGSWVQVATVPFHSLAVPLRRLTVFRFMHPGPTDLTMSITIDFGGVAQTGCAWTIVEVSGLRTSGTNGSDAVVQSDTDSADAVTSLAALSLAAFADPKNVAFAVVGLGLNTDVTPEALWSEIADVGQSLPAMELEASWRGSEDASPAPTWASANAAGVTLELAIVSSGVAFSTSVSDTLTLGETLLRSTGKLIVETLGVSETLTRLTTRALVEDVTLSETLTRQMQKVLADSATLSESLSRQEQKLLAESLTLTEADRFDILKTLTESTVLSENDRQEAQKLLAETVALTEALSRVATKALVESVTLIESDQAAVQKVLSDAIGLVEALSARATRVISITDTLTLQETQSRSILRALTDGLLLTEARIAAVSRRDAEALGLFETLTPSLLRALDDSLLLGEAFQPLQIAGVIITLPRMRARLLGQGRQVVRLGTVRFTARLPVARQKVPLR